MEKENGSHSTQVARPESPASEIHSIILEDQMKGQVERAVRSHAGIVALAAALVAVTGSSVAAQDAAPERVQSSVALSFIQARPVGALGGNIGFGYRGSAALLVPVERRGVLSLRAAAGIAEYGHEETRTAFSETVGGRVDVNVRTSNAVVPFHVGLELSPAASGAAPPSDPSGTHPFG
jgi:hypothetical protein